MPFFKVAVEDGATFECSISTTGADDYSACAVRNRQRFVHEVTGATLAHVSSHSFDPHLAAGNCEHFTGVAQIPLGFAGPITINGEHAQGDFFALARHLYSYVRAGIGVDERVVHEVREGAG